MQYVSINNYKPGLLQVKSGVPQRSILGPLLFIIYVNDLSSVINNSHILGYADDIKCYKHMVTQFDQQLLQDDLNSLLHWSKLVDLSFNPNKCVHICINPKIIQSCFLGDNVIPTRSIQSDFGVAICDNYLQWSEHHNNILSKAYKMLGLVRRTFCANISTITKTKLYICLICSQIMYCSILWCPHLIQDFTKIERLQRRATKYILNDFSTDYKSHLIQLKLLPLMYIFELMDIMFFIISLKAPTSNFNITDYVTFSSSTTRSSSGLKLIHNFSSNNKVRNLYFNSLARLWKSFPIIDLHLPINTIKGHATQTIFMETLYE